MVYFSVICTVTLFMLMIYNVYIYIPGGDSHIIRTGVVGVPFRG